MAIFKNRKVEAGSVAEPTLELASIAPALNPSKIDITKALLTQAEGASLKQLTDATSWLPHTMRAALTGLRRRGHAIERFSCDGVTHWRISAAPAPHESQADGDDRPGNAGSIAPQGESAQGISA